MKTVATYIFLVSSQHRDVIVFNEILTLRNSVKREEVLCKLMFDRGSMTKRNRIDTCGGILVLFFFHSRARVTFKHSH